MKQKTVAIIGGGASGMMAAIVAARKGAQVSLFEGNSKLGKKLKMTGNGRCNFTNANVDSSMYDENEEEKVGEILSAFGISDTIAFFDDIGIIGRQVGDLYYPYSLEAKSLVTCMRHALEDEDVSVMTDTKVLDIEQHKNGFKLTTKDKDYFSNALILACGGKAYPKTGSTGKGYAFAKKLGHTIEKPIPALSAFITEKDPLLKAHGVRIESLMTAFILDQEIAEEIGELQITDYGLSGIAIMNLSNILSRSLDLGRECYIKIDFLPDVSLEDILSFLKKRLNRVPEYRVSDALEGLFPHKLIPALLKKSNISSEFVCKDMDETRIEGLISVIKNYMVRVVDTRGFDHAQTTLGGVLMNEINVSTMESTLVPHLYFSGEILNVTGFCGGYNLQWAWSTGYLAGLNAAETLHKY